MTLPPKTAYSGKNIPMHLDSDSGLLVPNEPIPEFGASLTDLAFDDQMYTSILDPFQDKAESEVLRGGS